MTKIEKCNRNTHNLFVGLLNKAFLDKFQESLSTTFSVVTMSMITSLESGDNFTESQRNFVEAYCLGYVACQKCIVEN